MKKNKTKIMKNNKNQNPIVSKNKNNWAKTINKQLKYYK